MYSFFWCVSLKSLYNQSCPSWSFPLELENKMPIVFRYKEREKISFQGWNSPIYSSSRDLTCSCFLQSFLPVPIINSKLASTKRHGCQIVLLVSKKTITISFCLKIFYDHSCWCTKRCVAWLQSWVGWMVPMLWICTIPGLELISTLNF